jgi:hypothetical protein
MTPTDRRPDRGPSTSSGHHSHDDHLHDDPLHNEDVDHEHSDVNVRAVMLFAVGLTAVVVASAAAMYGLFGVFERMARSNEPAVTPLARPAGQEPPQPRLLLDEAQNLQQFRAGLAERLTGLDDAKKRLLEQGLPVRSDAPADPRLGTHAAARGESSGGRGILKPGPPGTEPPPPAPSAAPAPPPKPGGHQEE